MLHLNHSTVILFERRRADAVAQELGGRIELMLVIIDLIFRRRWLVLPVVDIIAAKNLHLLKKGVKRKEWRERE